mgnify:FL=1
MTNNNEDCISWHPCIKKIMNSFIISGKWIFSLYPIETIKSDITAREMLHDSMRTTANCRYKASERLRFKIHSLYSLLHIYHLVLY